MAVTSLKDDGVFKLFQVFFLLFLCVSLNLPSEQMEKVCRKRKRSLLSNSVDGLRRSPPLKKVMQSRNAWYFDISVIKPQLRAWWGKWEVAIL